MPQKLKIEIISGGKRLTLPAERDQTIRHALALAGFFVGVCGGGRCGKCRVRVLSGAVSETPDADGCVLSCKAKILSDLVIAEVASCPIRRTQGEGNACTAAGELGVAVDIGTTTVAVSAYDLVTHAHVGTLTAKNPQAAFGADVISRISASQTHLFELSRCVRAALANMTASLCGGSIKRAVIAANTVMSELLLGNDPRYLGNAHATLAHHRAVRLYGADCAAMTGISADEVTLFPHISPFVGGDITAGIFSLFPAPPAEPALLCDLGTNGEVALIHGEEIVCSSAAAGPAFEGGGIECGMEYADGAISHVSDGGNSLTLEVVGKKTPVGICGSGICDALAFMLRRGIIRRDGSLAPRNELPDAFATRVRDDRFYLTGSVYISQEDVRAFQLARAAIKCAVDAVCARLGKAPATVFVAGGFGSAARPDALKTLGILPDGARAEAVGCSALDGAKRLLLSPELLASAESIATRAVNVPLALSESFESDFMKRINF